MSWSRATIVRGVVVICAMLALSGCFRPLYGPSASGGSDVRASLAAISVGKVDGALGFYLNDELKFDLDGSGNPAPKRYRLELVASSSQQTISVDGATGRTEGSLLNATARYTLRPIEGGQVLKTGTLTSQTSFDRFGSRFASVRAQRDAEIRAAKALADQIRLELAVFFATNPPA
jgi:LPS-assembly lipoprotein